VDHLDVEFGVFEGWVVEGVEVVEEVASGGAVGVDDGAVEAEVVVVLKDLLVDGGVVDGDGDERDLGSLGVTQVEEAAVEVFGGGGGDFVVVGGDELEAGFIEGEGGVGVVGDDDADGDEGVADVREAEEGAVFGVVAGVDCDGDFFVGVGIDSGVFGGGTGRGRFFVGGVGVGWEDTEDGSDGEAEGGNQVEDGAAVGPERVHGLIDYDVR